jgi:hypothetical protein
MASRSVVKFFYIPIREVKPWPPHIIPRPF